MKAASPEEAASLWSDETKLFRIAGASADDAGRAWFRGLVRHVATTLGVDYAFVAELATSGDRARSVALWGRDRWLDDIEYDLAGTPCQEVLQGQRCHHVDGLCERFPTDRLLAELGARSFVGVPLVGGGGKILGHLAALHTKPLLEDSPGLKVLDAFADRARAELERLLAEESLRKSLAELELEVARQGEDLAAAHHELEALLGINEAVSKHLNREALFDEIARVLGSVLPAELLVIFVEGAESAVIYETRKESGSSRLVSGERVPRHDSVVGWVLDHGEVVIPDLAEVRRRFPTTWAKLEQEGMKAVCALPLITQGHCLGAVGLMASAPDAYRDVAPGFLEKIGTGLAIALDNSLNYEKLSRQGRELEALLAVNVAIRRRLTRDELFDTLAECLRDLLPSDRMGIELPVTDALLETHILHPRSPHGFPDRVQQLPSAGTACRWAQQNRQWRVAASRGELAEAFPVTHAVMAREGMESLCAIPLISADQSLGVLFFMAARQGAYEGVSLSLLEQLASSVAVALDNSLAHEELRRIRDRLAAENTYLQEEIRQQHGFDEIVGGSPALLGVLAQVEVVAGSDATVVILGETGTGKELIARAIHNRSRRRGRPLIKVNCSAISAGLVESELFGHVKGAFTGAVSNRQGRFELADKGTLFLDEIGDLSLETQVKLLRVLQEQEFERVGSSKTQKVDVRVIAATNRDLARLMEEGRFRSDLYYRLNVMPIRLPPLRERRQDIALLARHFQERFTRELGKPLGPLPEEMLERFAAYDWPGNVRELQNVVERWVVLAGSPIAQSLPDEPAARALAPRVDGAGNGTLEEVERRHIEAILEDTSWVIEGPEGAARKLGLHPSTLRSRMQKLGVRRARVRLA